MFSLSLYRRRIVAAALAVLAAGTVSVLQAPAAQAATGPVTVSLTFNDGLASQYQFARAVLASHNVNGTFYVASNWVATSDAKYMRSYQLDDLYRDGNEIGGMGKDHKDLTATYSSDPSADLAYKQDQVCGDKQKLNDLGYAPVSFSYPFAAVNAGAQSVVAGCGYLSGRTVGGLSSTGPTYSEAVPPANSYNVRTLATPSGPITLAAMQNAVNAVATRDGGWLPLAFNAVCSSSDPGYSSCMAGAKPVDAAVLSQFLDWMASGSAPAGSSIKTVRSVMGAAAQPPLPPRPTAVSLTFDDGLLSQYGVRSLLSAHGQKGTFYINTGAIDDNEQGAMSWPQVQDIAGDGNDVGGHTRTHVNLTSTSTTYESKWREVCDDRARLLAKGLNPVSFAYPEGAFNAAAVGIVKGCGYQSARTAGALSAAGPKYAESLTPSDPYTFQALGTTYNGPITLQSLQDAVDAAVSHGGGWVPMVFHQVCYPGTAYDRMHEQLPTRGQRRPGRLHDLADRQRRAWRLGAHPGRRHRRRRGGTTGHRPDAGRGFDGDHQSADDQRRSGRGRRHRHGGGLLRAVHDGLALGDPHRGARGGRRLERAAEHHADQRHVHRAGDADQVEQHRAKHPGHLHGRRALTWLGNGPVGRTQRSGGARPIGSGALRLLLGLRRPAVVTTPEPVLCQGVDSGGEIPTVAARGPDRRQPSQVRPSCERVGVHVQDQGRLPGRQVEG